MQEVVSDDTLQPVSVSVVSVAAVAVQHLELAQTAGVPGANYLVDGSPDVAVGSVRVTEHEVADKLVDVGFGSVLACVDSVHEVAVAELKDRRSLSAVNTNSLRVVLNAPLLDVQDDARVESFTQEPRVGRVPQRAVDDPRLDAPFVIAFELVDRGVRRPLLNLVEELVGSGNVVLERVLPLGNISKRVVLGQESAAV